MNSSDHIQLVREISRSSIATVWEGHDAHLDRRVFVKTLHPQLIRDKELRQRFEREARAVASLAHPNIVRIYELRMADEELSLIMEFVEGRSLQDVLKEHKILPPEVAATIAGEILAGLAAAHEKGIVHRDLKPDNVLISDGGEVKIADFGLAIVRDLPGLTQTGAIVGTPTYMAPEQAAGEEITPRTDLFALGLILFEMLTGHKLLEGKTLAESLQKVIGFQLPRFSDYRERISPEIERVLVRLLNRKPARRFEDAEAARNALGTATKELHLPEASVVLRDFVVQPPVEEPTKFKPVPPHRIRRFLIPATLVILVVLVAIIVYSISQREPRQEITLTPELKLSDTSEYYGPPSELIGEEPRDSTRVEPEPEKELEQTEPYHPPKPIPEETVTDTAQFPEEIALLVEPARLRILCQPWARVFVDGKEVGTTPLEEAIVLSAGQHEVIFLNPEFPPVTKTITVKGGEEYPLSVSLFDYVGMVRIVSVKPWADIYLDDTLVDRTPTSNPIIVTLDEEHTIRLVHPDYPAWEKRVVFQSSDPPLEIRVDLTKPP